MAAVFVLGLGMRRAVLYAQEVQIEGELPFSLESALHYRRTKILYDRGELPVVDSMIQYPEGIRIAEIDSIASEPVYARLARLFPESFTFHQRLRWIEAGWFCLSMPLLMVLIRVWTGSWLGGFFVAVLYGVSLSTVLRSTGQEISRENFAMPWLIAAHVFSALYYRAVTGNGRIVSGICIAATMAMALIGWDMIQYVLAIWVFGVSLHLVLRGPDYDRRLIGCFRWIFFGVVLTGALHPYYRFHGLLLSPLIVWKLSALLCAWYLARPALRETGGRAGRIMKRAGIIAGPVLITAAVSAFGAYGASYGHFAELLWAKIRFLNQKPADPSLMTFYQRIMWVPSLHSANWVLTKWLFPFTFWVSCVIAIAAVFMSRRKPDPLIRHWILLFFVSAAAFILFVRFHVFVGLAAAVICGWFCGRVSRRGIIGAAAAGGLLVILSAAEGAHTWRQRDVMGRPNVYYNELRELSNWLEENLAPDPVLGNIGVSAYAAAYGKCAVVMHPKFEDPSIRSRLETYGELLFGDNEKDLRDWMTGMGVHHLIYAYGEFASIMPEYQMRYFVNRMDPPPASPARRFEGGDDSMRYFKRLWKNHKYAVYRALPVEEEVEANDFADHAQRMLEEGRLQEAEAFALKSLSIDEGQEKALRVMRHVGSLYEQGFRGPEASAP